MLIGSDLVEDILEVLNFVCTIANIITGILIVVFMIGIGIENKNRKGK